MIYILFIIFAILLIVCIALSDDYSECPQFFGAICIAAILGTIIAWLITIGSYNTIKTTNEAHLRILEEQNEIVISQIEPLVEKALEYESSTYKELTPEEIIACGNMYPELKANEFIQTQIQIILKNQEEIKKLKIEKIKLNTFSFWLWTKKVNYDEGSE